MCYLFEYLSSKFNKKPNFNSINSMQQIIEILKSETYRLLQMLPANIVLTTFDSRLMSMSWELLFTPRRTKSWRTNFIGPIVASSRTFNTVKFSKNAFMNEKKNCIFATTRVKWLMCMWFIESIKQINVFNLVTGIMGSGVDGFKWTGSHIKYKK